MKTIITLLALSVAFSLSSCKKKTGTKLEDLPPKTEVVETIQIEEEPVKEEPKPEVKQMNYFLVAGCFKVQENAQRLFENLVSQGYSAKIMPYYNYHMVTYNGYETRAEAQAALNRIVQETGKENAWVYPVK